MNRPASVGLSPERPSVLRVVGRALLDWFSSVWLGIFLAALLFVYCTIGSAIPSVRQHPALEMTEFEWFHWWPFNMLIILFSANLIIVTVRRIPLHLVNLGVWAVHGGIIVLVIGSYYYFTTKLEGDAPVIRRSVVIQLPGADSSARMPALPGSRTVLRAAAGEWRFQVQETNANWPILSDEHRGETAYAVNVLVQPPDDEAFVRQLLDGYPQYTEDVLPGRGRAVNVIGRKLLNDRLSISLAYEPQEYFHLMDTWALFIRRAGEGEWRQRPIRDLPRYHEHIGSRDLVFTDPHHSIPLRAIDVPVPPAPEGDPLASANIRITGYLRYASMQRRWRDNGRQLNPVLRGRILSGNSPAQSFELVAFDRVANRTENGLIEFRRLDDVARIDELPMDSRPLLSLTVPEADVSTQIPITQQNRVGPAGEFTEVEGTPFSYRIVNVHNNLVLPGDGRRVSVAMVDIRTPEGQFTRMVADSEEMTRDMHGPNADPHAPMGRTPEPPDPRIVMTYQPESAPVLYALHPDGLFLVVNGPEGRLLGRDVDVGTTVQVVPGLDLRVDELLTHAVAEVKPYVVPPSARQRDVGENLSMIRLEIDDGHGRLQSRWVRFNRYALPGEQYAYGGRFAYFPERFRLTDGTIVEVLFSRQRRPLPARIALDHFTLDTHIGGYTGQPLTIRNYVSQLRFLDDGQWTDPTPIRVNAPTEFGGYWYFQSMWDKPESDDPAGGMNYTGLGVGNRNGVWIQLAGCCLSIAGLIFAFYVKPVLRRRRQLRSQQVRMAVPEDGVLGSEQKDAQSLVRSGSAEPVLNR